MATQPYVRPPTIHDVARVAKLSKSTVSNVIRNASGVHPATRERVLAAISELGYQTNIVARQLVQQRTSILGMVIGDLANAFHAEMAKLIAGAAAALGYQVMFCNARAPTEPDFDGIQRMLEHRVAGLIFLSCRAAAERARHLVSGRIPTVFVSCDAGWGDVVAVDERAAGLAATALLISEGHRRIWHLAEEPPGACQPCDRQLGYAEAMALAGLPSRLMCLSRDGKTAIIGGAAMPAADVLLGEDGPTAIFAANDARALQVMGVAEQLGLGVPETLSIFGFDDSEVARNGRIGLTTVSQPKEALAQLAVETLLRRASGKAAPEPSRQLVGFQLMLRHSTAAPRRAGGALQGFPALVSAYRHPLQPP